MNFQEMRDLSNVAKNNNRDLPQISRITVTDNFNQSYKNDLSHLPKVSNSD